MLVCGKLADHNIPTKYYVGPIPRSELTTHSLSQQFTQQLIQC